MQTQILAKAIALRAQGETYPKIAEKLNIPQTTVYDNLTTDNTRALVEQEAKELISAGLIPSRKTIVRLAKYAADETKSIDELDDKRLKLSLDASKTILSAAQITGNTPGTIINTFIQVNHAPAESQEVIDIRSFLQSKLQTQTIDVAPSHTATDCAEIAQIEAKQDTCQIAEVEGAPGDGLEDPPDQG
jgi:hypothetical protein